MGKGIGRPAWKTAWKSVASDERRRSLAGWMAGRESLPWVQPRGAMSIALVL
jgi:hypothetical protein